ncbi:phosphate/phosphite/phosphonate ABC transporter substrate-binding protein [Geothrix sp. PMB-07]|uniref:phosphate/phosphite/phosphonate ABC transporter substrate-binding protein n=1 Tax=Geothrix sp. PMB-07 TaxID=3068640 RepID=UPI0027416865|nr:PhnD/SsuA/transferrin family substrate-binding protein [Geothrix sp. PMB-07]WLT33188.1 PhnD/SsuA/transferrin family substrate-binding protein [Geothrix sp. PMB-07]
MNRIWFRCLRLVGLAFLVALGAGAQTTAGPFRLGIAPHTSTRVILEMYQPLRAHLEKALGMPVEVQTAPDFTEFARRALHHEYDLVVTTGHQARLLQTDAHHIPLLTYKADFKAVAVVVAKSSYKTPKDLRGTTTIGLSTTSLVTLWGQHWLKSQGLSQVPVRYVSAADSVAQLLLAGEGSAGFVSLANFQKLPPDVQGALRLLAESPAMLGRVYLLDQGQAAKKDRILKELWAFAESEAGRQYLEKNKLEGYRPLKKRELESMDPYAAEVRQTLQQK